MLYTGICASVTSNQDLGARGPILAVDAVVCAPHCVSSLYASSLSTPSVNTTSTTARRGASKSTTSSSSTSARTTAVPAGTGTGASSGKASRGRDATDSLVAVLDSCGSVKFTLFSFYAEVGEEGALQRLATPFSRSITVKVPAANASGVSVCVIACTFVFLSCKITIHRGLYSRRYPFCCFHVLQVYLTLSYLSLGSFSHNVSLSSFCVPIGPAHAESVSPAEPPLSSLPGSGGYP